MVKFHGRIDLKAASPRMPFLCALCESLRLCAKQILLSSFLISSEEINKTTPQPDPAADSLNSPPPARPS
jgi:hypothetical protein